MMNNISYGGTMLNCYYGKIVDMTLIRMGSTPRETRVYYRHGSEMARNENKNI